MDLKEVECAANGKLKSIPSANESSKNIGLTYNGIPTYVIADAIILKPSMSSAVVSHARTSALGLRRGWTEREVGCGQNTSESFANYNHDTSSWKTSQRSLLGGWNEFSGTWPPSGMMQNGECFELRSSALRINENVSSPLPTLLASECKDFSRAKILANLGLRPCGDGGRIARRLCTNSPSLRLSEDYVGLNPYFGEWMLGFPQGWTNYESMASETPSYLKLRSGSEIVSSQKAELAVEVENQIALFSGMSTYEDYDDG